MNLILGMLLPIGSDRWSAGGLKKCHLEELDSLVDWSAPSHFLSFSLFLFLKP